MALFRRLFGARAPEPPPPPPEVDRDALVGALIAEVRALGIAGALRVEGNYLFIDESDGMSRHVFLGNIAAEYAAAALAERVQLIARYARLAARPIGTSKPDLQTRLLPKLTPRRDLEAMRRGNVANLIAGAPIAGGDLEVELALEDRDSISVVTASELATGGLTEDEAYARACANLRQRSTGKWRELVPGLFRSPWSDHFDGARLALPSLFRGLPVRGKPLVIVPTRSTLLVSGTEEPLGLLTLCQAAAGLMELDRPVYMKPLVLDGDTWRHLDMEADRKAIMLAPSLVFLEELQAILDLGACGQMVREQLLASGFTHVGEWGVLRADDMPTTTSSSLPVGERVAIPKVASVMFGDAMVVWYKLEAILGPDLVPLDVWPPHYEVRRRPSADEIAATRIGARRN